MTEIPVEQQARDSLAVLGLAHRIEDEDAAWIDADTWREIARLAHCVIECVTFQEPARSGPVYPWLRVGSLRTAWNACGYCTHRPVEPVYWIPKADLPRLRELEDYLDLAVAHVRWAAIQAGKETTVPLEDVIKRLGLGE